MKRLLLLIVLLGLGAGAAGAQEGFEPSPALEAQMAQLEEVTIAIRGLEGEPVERAFPSRAETAAYMAALFDEQVPLEDMARYERFYQALDLMEPTVDLRAVYLELLEAQVAGFYDTDTKVMNVVPLTGSLGDELNVTQAVTYVHEFVHALQDQFFDLDAITEAEEMTDNVDLGLAVTALIEGDATAVMMLYTQALVQRNPLAALALLGEGLAAGSLVLPPGVPDILSRELLFPYEGGLDFVVALQTEGGWERVDSAYRDLPATSEQILHPEKYLAGETAVDVPLADVAGVLGGSWRQIWDTTLGEWYLREHLMTQLTAREARDAAAGWGGDRLLMYEDDERGAAAWLLGLAWDTPADAAEFEAAYRAFAAARYGAAESGDCWSDAGSATCLSAGGTVTLVGRAPTLDEARALLVAQG